MSETTRAQKMLTHEDYPHLSSEEWASVYRLALVIGNDAVRAMLLNGTPETLSVMGRFHYVGKVMIFPLMGCAQLSSS